MSDVANEEGAGGYLVYIRRMGQLMPQWWPELYFGERGDRRAEIVAIVPLEEGEFTTLDEVVRRHPFKAGAGLPWSGGGDV